VGVFNSKGGSGISARGGRFFQKGNGDKLSLQQAQDGSILDWSKRGGEGRGGALIFFQEGRKILLLGGDEGAQWGRGGGDSTSLGKKRFRHLYCFDSLGGGLDEM